jgi:hypothetical protein
LTRLTAAHFLNRFFTSRVQGLRPGAFKAMGHLNVTVVQPPHLALLLLHHPIFALRLGQHLLLARGGDRGDRLREGREGRERRPAGGGHHLGSLGSLGILGSLGSLGSLDVVCVPGTIRANSQMRRWVVKDSKSLGWSPRGRHPTFSTTERNQTCRCRS